MKNLRNGVVDRLFRSCGVARGRRLAEELADRGVRRAAFAVAFNAPWAIDLLTQSWRRHPPGLDLVVIDNSRSARARSEHAAICRSRGVPWLGLPFNPEWSPNRSHGIALNWIWFNVVRHAPLDLVGFIDHDCFPIRPLDLPRRMEGRAVYGLRGVSRTHPPAWNIWSGYCFLRTAATSGRTVDFKHRIELGLDTGGGNWPGLYRHLDPSEVGDAAHGHLRIDLGDDSPAREFLLLDDAFVHLDGASYRPAFADPRSRDPLLAAIRERYLA